MKLFKSKILEQKTEETISSREKANVLLEQLAKIHGLITIGDKEYEDKQGNKFIKTPLGFVRKEEQSLKVEKYLSDNSTEINSCNLAEEKAEEQDYLERMKKKVKELKYDMARLNMLIDRVVDKNTSTQKKMARVERNNKSQLAQIDNLKKTNEVLLKDNVRLVREKEEKFE